MKVIETILNFFKFTLPFIAAYLVGKFRNKNKIQENTNEIIKRAKEERERVNYNSTNNKLRSKQSK